MAPGKREWKHGQNGRNGVPYSREVARFALFGGRLPKVKVLTADVPINVICVVLWVGRVFLRLQNKKR